MNHRHTKLFIVLLMFVNDSCTCNTVTVYNPPMSFNYITYLSYSIYNG